MTFQWSIVVSEAIFPTTLPHQAGIELSDFHARGWKSDQGGRNSMQEMHGNQTKCMEFQPIKELPYFAQESILVALKACGFDGPKTL